MLPLLHILRRNMFRLTTGRHGDMSDLDYTFHTIRLPEQMLNFPETKKRNHGSTWYSYVVFSL